MPERTGRVARKPRAASLPTILVTLGLILLEAGYLAYMVRLTLTWNASISGAFSNFNNTSPPNDGPRTCVVNALFPCSAQSTNCSDSCCPSIYTCKITNTTSLGQRLFCRSNRELCGDEEVCLTLAVSPAAAECSLAGLCRSKQSASFVFSVIIALVITSLAIHIAVFGLAVAYFVLRHRGHPWSEWVEVLKFVLLAIEIILTIAIQVIMAVSKASNFIFTIRDADCWNVRGSGPVYDLVGFIQEYTSVAILTLLMQALTLIGEILEHAERRKEAEAAANGKDDL